MGRVNPTSADRPAGGQIHGQDLSNLVAEFTETSPGQVGEKN